MTASREQHRNPARSTARRWLGLIPFVLAVAVAAVAGSLAAQDSQSTYEALELPVFAPPSWLFGPAWTVLYVMIAVAGWLVWLRSGIDRAIWLWIVQLVLNGAWTPLFFAAGLFEVALAEIAVMWIAICVTTVMFWRRRLAGALLMVPYLAWVTYAAALNLGIVVLN